MSRCTPLSFCLWLLQFPSRQCPGDIVPRCDHYRLPSLVCTTLRRAVREEIHAGTDFPESSSRRLSDGVWAGVFVVDSRQVHDGLADTFGPWWYLKVCVGGSWLVFHARYLFAEDFSN